MKKSIVVQTIITMVLIFVALGFGVYAIMQANSQHNSRFNITVKDSNVNVEISGNAGWMNGLPDQTFTTEIGKDGISNTVWNLTDLYLTEKHQTTPEKLSLSIGNKNRSEALNFKIVVEGLAFDEYDRFSTYVSYTCDEDQASESFKITKDAPKFEMVVSGSTETVALEFKYVVNSINTSFEVAQNIKMTMSMEVKTQ